MVARDFFPGRLLRSLDGTGPFRDYCRLRSIPYPPQSNADGPMTSGEGWTTALGALPPDDQAGVGSPEGGGLPRRRLRRPLPLLFVSEPLAGAVRLKSPFRSADRVRALFQCFGGAVLGAPVEPAADTFDLEPLKYGFRALPDAP